MTTAISNPAAPGAAPRPTRQSDRPRHRLHHIIHHIEPNGVIHCMCGHTIPPTTGGLTTRPGDVCPACEAAMYLLEVMP
ncbi:hypothetical protein [Corynebacterium glucuronolyticum]|uniref:hypothetical protein n=1 Tax=Corynebacterium glucuronolyticum TaxID=39791 RepID=UPI0012DE0013|nr:hypothetical protein [Corynebacterium glucuronolyticum]QRO81957.1 hypothetical protein I6J20_08750 [Corynebacterium glucuronolyticum]